MRVLQNLSCRISGILIILFFSLPSNGIAQKASPEQIKEVQSEIQKFKKSWSEKLPYESKFGIIQLCSLLNLDYPGLEKVKLAVAKSNWANAEKELVAYYKNRSQDTKLQVKKLSDLELEASESALNHYFRGNRKAHPLIYRGKNIDWFSPAQFEGKEIKDKEWQFQYMRFVWWEALAKAYQLNKDEKYYDEWLYEMVDFAHDVLPITKETPKHISRGMETYNRCAMLREVFPYFVSKDNFDAKTLLYFLTSFHMQAEHIRKVYSEKGNHLMGELITVFENAIDFPEFKKSDEWIQETITTIPQRMFIEIYPDGMNKEYVFSYHSMYLSIFTDAYVMFQKYGYEDKLPKEYKSVLVKMAEIYMYQMFPDNSMSQFGDAWKHRDAAGTFKKSVSQFGTDLPYYDFIVSNGKKGIAPAKTSVAYPLSGFYFFRSEWSPDAVFLSMKNNPEYTWHSQLDNGTFELFAYGRNFMNDSGSYIYESGDPIEQEWRKWFKSSAAHQTLTLNNKDIGIDAKHIFWKESKDLVCLVNENKSYNDLMHRRTTLFVDNKYFLVYDQAIGAAQGNVGVHFQLVPCDFIQNPENLSVTTNFKEGSNLVVQSFSTAKPGKMKKEEGWISYDPLKKQERPAWSIEIEKSAGQAQVDLLTVLAPYKENKKPMKLEATVTEKGETLNFELKVDNSSYSIILNTSKGTAEVKKNNK
jgi:heparan-sulfate lyase